MECKVPGMSCDNMECSFGCAYEDIFGPLPGSEQESTLFADIHGREIMVGDRVRLSTEINVEVHGKWVDYTVIKRPGGYALSYLISEKGQILPVGYSGNYMPDIALGGGNTDLKHLLHVCHLPEVCELFEVINE